MKNKLQKLIDKYNKELLDIEDERGTSYLDAWQDGAFDQLEDVIEDLEMIINS